MGWWDYCLVVRWSNYYFYRFGIKQCRNGFLKFVFSKKAKKLTKSSSSIWHLIHNIKLMVNTSFLENMIFTRWIWSSWHGFTNFMKYKFQFDQFKGLPTVFILLGKTFILAFLVYFDIVENFYPTKKAQKVKKWKFAANICLIHVS